MLVILAVVAGCAAGQNPISERVWTSGAGAGFWIGAWHGFIAPFTLVGSIFTDVGVYEVRNVGFWYDLGFLTGLALSFGLVAIVTEGEGALLVLVGAVAVMVLRGLFDAAVFIVPLLRR